MDASNKTIVFCAFALSQIKSGDAILILNWSMVSSDIYNT